MHEYELTERGKIVIAILLVLFLLLLPSAILAYKAWSGSTNENPENQITTTHERVLEIKQI